jgi:catechol 2,3-dioxygenase-like lactoylglutathione lyase family enzyme
VILYVTAMATSVAFWRDEIGLALLSPSDSSDLAAEVWVTLDGGGFELALHTGREPGEKSSPAFSFFVDDLAAAVADIESRGVWTSGIINPHPGVTFCRVEDPDGHVFFIKPAPGSNR